MVTIVPYTDAHAEALAALAVKPEQVQFVVENAKLLVDQLNENEHPVLMLLAEKVVGFFYLDLGYQAAHSFCLPSAIGVRMVMLDQRYQGQGIGSKALSQLPTYIKQYYPDCDALFLTVNCRNKQAYRSYEKCGFIDTGELYLGGPVGPQHIMKLAVNQ